MSRCIVRQAARLLLVIFMAASAFAPAHAQEIYQHVKNTDIYDFVDELANVGVIDINSAIKPYSRKFIAQKLAEASGKREELNARQMKDLDFYLLDFNKELKPDKNFKKRLDLLYYKDTLFTFSFNPILGMSVYNNDSGSFYHRWNGAEAYAYVGEHFGFYASLRDNHESKRMSDPTYLNQNDASNYKVDTKGGGDFDEMRGGLTYTWKWGSLGLVKDHMVWGDNYHGSNILSGHQPSFTMLKLHLQPVRWFDFNYIHGWLVSDVVDSSRSYVNGQSLRKVYRQKYIAANMFTFTPWRKFQFSIGNSIIYSDQDVQPAYLVPFFFYKTVDHAQTSTGSNFLGQNSQLFFNISSRNLKNVHLYASVFVDEIALSRATDKDKHTNFYSLKAGLHLSNLGLDNLFFTAEYTRTNPLAYRHYIESATYASSSYNMGHYLGDNSEEGYVCIGYRPISKLKVEASYTLASKGYEYAYTGVSSDPIGNGLGKPFLNRVYWQMKSIELKAHYQIVNDAWIFAGLESSDCTGKSNELNTYTMPEYIGKLTTINVGANIGF
ncbi:MAG TPA: hypothetical protein PKK99_09770 [Bacteroidia bacterium]|nr:hypothetical protein [Bacteroidia bacterium]HNP99333.1 hypothetical protein [Bacteroidia bacterium]